MEVGNSNDRKENSCCYRHRIKIGLGLTVVLLCAIGVFVYFYFFKKPVYNFSGLGIANCTNIANADSPRIDHSLWNSILKKYVTEDQESLGVRFNSIDYHAIKDDRTDLNEYLLLLENSPTTGMSCEEQKALWINSYNALAVKVMIDNDIPASIRDITNVWTNTAGKVGGIEYSLDGIEKGVLLKMLPDARVHAAVNCASLSCPDLRAEAYTGEDLETQLNEQCTSWMNNPTKGVDVNAGTKPKVSKIFLWYTPDFERDYGSIQAFMTKFGNNVQLDASNSVQFMQYFWERNQVAAGFNRGTSLTPLFTSFLVVSAVLVN